MSPSMIADKIPLPDPLDNIPGLPPGGVKLMQALRSLLETRHFDSITTAEIASVAGVNEALIYRYFGDKRGLLHKILAEYFKIHLAQIRNDVACGEDAVGKLRVLIEGTISFHKINSVFSRILLLEVRNNPAYFQSEAYELARQYSRLINEIIEQGIREKVMRSDIPLSCMRDVLIGSIERACMRPAIFEKDFDEKRLARHLADAVIGGFGACSPKETRT
uniref:TetR/AcrR family transcriptional regulator n=1 Tax=Desulfomonile tiedjei TaxID=2358 RepID=A0A7C4AQ39_9BACT